MDASNNLLLDGSGNFVSQSSVGNPLLFTAARYDAETSGRTASVSTDRAGKYYLRNRYQDPNKGRFITRDPIGIWGDNINLGNGYGYCGNDPVNQRDPMGLKCPEDDKEKEKQKLEEKKREEKELKEWLEHTRKDIADLKKRGFTEDEIWAILIGENIDLDILKGLIGATEITKDLLKNVGKIRKYAERALRIAQELGRPTTDLSKVLEKLNNTAIPNELGAIKKFVFNLDVFLAATLSQGGRAARFRIAESRGSNHQDNGVLDHYQVGAENAVQAAAFVVSWKNLK